jgi:hypothetical protein
MFCVSGAAWPATVGIRVNRAEADSNGRLTLTEGGVPPGRVSLPSSYHSTQTGPEPVSKRYAQMSVPRLSFPRLYKRRSSR